MIICGIVASLIAGFSLALRIAVKRDLQQSKPYITYTRLMAVASDCDKFKAQYGAWPTSLDQLISFRPELSTWARDAWRAGDDVWGRYAILIQYDESLGYGEVVSYGRDGKPGGTGLDADLVVRFPTDANSDWNKQQGAGLKRPHYRP